MIPKELDGITADDLNALVDNAAAERRTLEFKSRLPCGTDREKKEFLADVSSLANAAGGDLIYGITAKHGVAERIDGLQDFNADEEILRLDNCLRHGIAPRIPGVLFKTVPVPTEDPVLLIRVPRSWQAPHMVVFKNSSRFFTRTTNGKHQLDVSEIRIAFLASETLAQRVERFLDERLAHVLANETPAPVHGSALVVLHLVPFAAMAPSDGQSTRATETMYAVRDSFRFLHEAAGSRHDRVNLEGVVSYSPPQGRRGGGYCQVYRTGIVEAVDALTLEPDPVEPCPEPFIVGDRLVDTLRESVTRYVNGLRRLGVAPPVVVRVALTGVRGWTLIGSAENNPSGPPFDRDPLILPPVVWGDLPDNPEEAIRPICDSLWNAAGRLRCNAWDSEGRPR